MDYVLTSLHGLNVEDTNKTVHSYIATNNTLLCNKCIINNNYDRNKIKPIPQVVTYLNSSLESAKNKKNHCLLQANRIKKELDKIRENVREVELKVLNELNKTKEIQFDKITNVFQQIDKMRETIINDIQNIDDLLSIDSQNKVNQCDSIERIKKSKNLYHKDLDFSSIETVDINFNDDCFGQIKHILNESFDIWVKPQEEQINKISKKVFNLKKVWYCYQCENRNTMSKSPIECMYCHTFKRIELYPTIFKRAKEISDIDLNHLEIRRDKEKQLFINFEEEKNKCHSPCYIVSADWIDNWKMFIFNQREESSITVKKSEYECVGILDPGPIQNSSLLTINGDPKPNLQKLRDYFAITEQLWNTLYNIYGGGPAIICADADIYSNSLEINADLSNDAQISEIKQLNIKKKDKKILKFKKHWDDLNEKIMNMAEEYEVIEEEKERSNSAETDMRTTLNADHESSEDMPEFIVREKTFHKGKEKIKNAINKFFTGMSSGWDKLLNR